MLSCLLAGDRELQFGNSAVDESEARLIAHVVLGEGRLFDRHFHGVAVERRLERVAVLEFAGGQVAVAAADLTVAPSAWASTALKSMSRAL